jgi:hypothetical protein
VDPKQPMYTCDGVPGGPLPSTQHTSQQQQQQQQQQQGLDEEQPHAHPPQPSLATVSL